MAPTTCALWAVAREVRSVPEVLPRCRRRQRGPALIAPFLLVFMSAVMALIVPVAYPGWHRDQMADGNHDGLASIRQALEDLRLHQAMGRVQLPAARARRFMIALAVARWRLPGPPAPRGPPSSVRQPEPAFPESRFSASYGPASRSAGPAGRIFVQGSETKREST